MSCNIQLKLKQWRCGNRLVGVNAWITTACIQGTAWAKACIFAYKTSFDNMFLVDGHRMMVEEIMRAGYFGSIPMRC